MRDELMCRVEVDGHTYVAFAGPDGAPMASLMGRYPAEFLRKVADALDGLRRPPTVEALERCMICGGKAQDGLLTCKAERCLQSARGKPFREIYAIRKDRCLEALRRSAPGVAYMHVTGRDGTEESFGVRVEQGRDEEKGG